MKNIRNFYLKNYHFLVVKFSVYLNRHFRNVNLSCFMVKEPWQILKENNDQPNLQVNKRDPDQTAWDLSLISALFL